MREQEMERMGLGMAGPGIMRMMLTLMDTDGDGMVSLAEFQAAHERLFRAMDSNKDGRVSFEEMQRFMHGSSSADQPDHSRQDRVPTQPATPPPQNNPRPQD
jgi:Ca2+-binding EF-hand superfamily protein